MNSKSMEHMQKENFELLQTITTGVVKDLKARRDKLTLSQRELSSLTGITQKTISRIENGIDVPKLSTIVRLAEAMNCKLEFDITRRKAE